MIETQVIDIIRNNLDLPENAVTLQSSLMSLGADSLDIIDIVLSIENEFDIELPDDQPMPNTVQDIVNHINKLKNM